MITFSIAQERYIDRKGVIEFEASEQSFEPVKAKNESVTILLNPATGEIASLTLVKEFRFRNALMEEHFNENYIESDEFPKAIFKGKLEEFAIAKLTDKEQEFKLKGTLKLHGVEKTIMPTLYILKKDEAIYVKGNFIVSPQDFEIEIPKIVRNKIAKEVKVRVDFKLVKK